MSTDIRRASDIDWPALWPIWHSIATAQETFMADPYAPMEQARRMWLADPPAETWLATDERGEILGTYLLRPNHPGPGSHVANTSVMVAPAARGRGIGRLLAQHCLDRAREAGYLAMQLNAVMTSNTAAIALWKTIGFEIIGTTPRAYQHRTLGFVDVHIMHRPL